MTKHRDRDRLPHPENLSWELDEIARLMARRSEIIRGYKMALELGLDPRSGSDGASVMAGLSDYVPEAAVTSDRAAGYRATAGSIFARTQEARKMLGNVLGSVNRGRMGEAFRQPTHTDRSAIITQDELDDAIAKKGRDGEMTG